ncbi:MAG TPA: MoxR family ATPase [Planctomycetota bacterium]|nr:MoxR family ATPase [Planctomycetota bacterium]
MMTVISPTPILPIQRQDLDRVSALRRNIESVILGKSDVVKLAVTALLARGHVLIEDIPGIGKTALARATARSISCAFRRIQFTPDLLPSDVTGVSVFDPDRKDFSFKRGPIFSNIILADEINRATPRTQSALLEAMGESRVSIDGVTHSLPSPFMVIATQNPLEFTGTYPLPESQLDRFLFVLKMGYPTPEEERQILTSRAATDPVESLQPAVSGEDINRLCDKVPEVRMDDAVTTYLLEIVNRTRNEKAFMAGVSPRGAIHLARASRAHALVDGRDYVLPDDVKAVAVNAMSHRVLERRARSSQDGRASAAQIIRRILQEVPVPQ